MNDSSCTLDDSKGGGDGRVCLVLTMAFATVTGTLLTQPAPQRGDFKENNRQTKDNAELLGKRGPFPFYPPPPLVLPVSALQRQCLYWFGAGEKVTLRTDYKVSSGPCGESELACVLLSRGHFFLLFLPSPILWLMAASNCFCPFCLIWFLQTFCKVCMHSFS